MTVVVGSSIAATRSHSIENRNSSGRKENIGFFTAELLFMNNPANFIQDIQNNHFPLKRECLLFNIIESIYVKL